MSRFDSVVVGAEMLSEHYLAEELGPRVVKPLRAAWAEQEEYGKVTSRRGLVALAGSFTARLVAARETPPERRPAALAALYADVREALGLRREVEAWAAARADGEVTGRGAVHRTATGAALLVLEADDAETVDALLDTGDAGLHGVTTPQGPEPTVAKAVSAVFNADPHPPLVLVHAGPWLLLAERERWAEGRWLAVDLAAAARRRDTRAQGELETVAALLGVESLVPDEGSGGFLGVLAASVTHAVGVSKDLRDGVRESVEVIGSEVLARRRAQGLADEAVPDLARQLFLQSLRYLYRVLFLLYAEARPELGVLPVGAPDYGQGYGLDRLRELALVDLTSPRSRTGTHLYESVPAAGRARRRRPRPGGPRRRRPRLRAAVRGPVPARRDRPGGRGRPGQRGAPDGAAPAAAEPGEEGEAGRLRLLRAAGNQPAGRRLRGPDGLRRLRRRRGPGGGGQGRRPREGLVDGAGGRVRHLRDRPDGPGAARGPGHGGDAPGRPPARLLRAAPVRTRAAAQRLLLHPAGADGLRGPPLPGRAPGPAGPGRHPTPDDGRAGAGPAGVRAGARLRRVSSWRPWSSWPTSTSTAGRTSSTPRSRPTRCRWSARRSRPT